MGFEEDVYEAVNSAISEDKSPQDFVRMAWGAWEDEMNQKLKRELHTFAEMIKATK